MSLSRIQRKTAAIAAVFFACLLPISAAVAQPAEDRVITAGGVGAAPLGLSPNDLAAELGADYDLGNEVRITVDFDGRVVTKAGEVQFRAAMTDDSDLLTLFIVSNADYQTVEGVGPTTTIADAEAIYGDATLSWNPDNEGREFVSFVNGPEGRVAFRTPGIGGTNVGIYEDGEFETTEYETGGAIAAVWVSCIPGTDCPADTAEPEPTSEPTPEPTPEATPEPTPEPTATAEPTATPAPTPSPVPTPAPGDTGSGSGGDELPNTGSDELLLMSLVSVLFVIGGAFVMIERSYLCPAWLSVRRR